MGMDDYKAPYVCMMTNSTCYKETTTMRVKGVLWHSTGSNNDTLKRYVQPLITDANYADAIDKLGKNKNGNDWNHIYKKAGLNSWIGRFRDSSVGTTQAMPWDFRPWGCGSGPKGSLNDGWIQFEICEEYLVENSRGQLVHYKDTPGDKEYAEYVWEQAVLFTAYICDKFGIDPLGYTTHKGVQVPNITCHHDAWKLGLGSGHGDINHWFPIVLGKDMSNARQEVYDLLHEHYGDGWVKRDGIWYYYVDNKPVTGWQDIDGSRYYFNEKGQMTTGWATFKDRKHYFGTDGAMSISWRRIDGIWYFFNDKGVMVHDNWLEYKDKWYYLNSDGSMRTEWLDYKGKRYYFKIADGSMITGWKRVGREWYYFNDDGIMQTGYQRIDGENYYLYPDGHLASDEWIDGKWYNHNGSQTYQYTAEWKEDDKGKWYEDELGWYPKDEEEKIDGVVYKFDKKGYLIN